MFMTLASIFRHVKPYLEGTGGNEGYMKLEHGLKGLELQESGGVGKCPLNSLSLQDKKKDRECWSSF